MGDAPAARLGAVYAALMAAHDLADHVIQTDHQAATKATSWRAMAGHVGSYQAAQALAVAALYPLGVRPAWWRLALASAWSTGTHALLDRRWPVRAILRATGSSSFARGQMTVPELVVLTETPEMAKERRLRDHTWGSTLHGNVQEQQVPAPLHGPYLADQALHHACLFVAALILAGGAR
jgi:hypothetical protein